MSALFFLHRPLSFTVVINNISTAEERIEKEADAGSFLKNLLRGCRK
jgi:hypothetical protein